MIRRCSRATLVMFLISTILINSSCNGSVKNQLSSIATPPKIEVSGVDASEFLQLRKVLSDVVVYAKTSANQDQKLMLSQIETMLGTVQPDSKIDNVLLQKTEDEQIILAMLEGTVGILAQSFFGIPSQIAEAFAKGVGELSSRISLWWGMRNIGWATITIPNKGVISLVYQKELKEVWVTSDVLGPAGSVSIYTPVEKSVLPPSNAGSTAAAIVLKAVVRDSRVAYRFGTLSSPPTTTKTAPATPATPPPTSPGVTSVTIPLGAASIGDFIAPLSSVDRLDSSAVLRFAVAKVGSTGSKARNATIVLADDHGNKYNGSLNILGSASDFVLSALPKGFSYIETVQISIPKVAPIASIKIGEKETLFKDVTLSKPQFITDYGNISVSSNQNTIVDDWLSFSIGQAIPELPSWKLPITMESKEYNPLTAEVRLAVQNWDGTISWGQSSSITVPALSKISVNLSLTFQESIPNPRALMLEVTDKRSGGLSTFKVFSMPPNKLLPFEVSEKMYKKWQEYFFTFGLPTGNEQPVSDSGVQGFSTTGWVQNFERGHIWYHSNGEYQGQAFNTALLFDSIRMGANGSWLGFPIMDQYISANGLVQSEWEGGYIAIPSLGPAKAFPYEQGKIAFVSDRDGNEEIYVTDPRGRTQTNLTKNSVNDSSPTWSPDGTKIAFVSDRQPSGIYVMNSDGSGQKFLAEGRDPSWSSDGSKIVFVRRLKFVTTRYFTQQTDYYYAIFVMNADGTGQRQVPLDPSTIVDGFIGRQFRYPTLSPDGSTVAFAIGQWESGHPYSIYSVKLDGTGLQQLSNNFNGILPYWDLDGRTILFVGDPGPNYRSGGPLRLLLPGSGGTGGVQEFNYTLNSKIWVWGGLAWGPGGGSIVISGKNKLQIIYLWDQIYRDLPGKGNNYDPSWVFSP